MIPIAYWATEEKTPQNLSHLKGSMNRRNPKKLLINYYIGIMILRELLQKQKDVLVHYKEDGSILQSVTEMVVI